MLRRQHGMTGLLLIATLGAALPATSLSLAQSSTNGPVETKDLPKPLLPRDAKPDVRFVFNYPDLNFHSGDAKKDAALKAARDSFEKAIRTQVYPLLREITGISLGKYVKEIRYTIVPDGSLGGGRGGLTHGVNQVKLDQRYSLATTPPADVHEMIHVFNANTQVLRGARDHIWHGALISAVQTRMGWPTQRRDSVTQELKRLMERIEKPKTKLSRNELHDLRSGILGVQLQLFYHDHGESHRPALPEHHESSPRCQTKSDNG
jgi:hypothetical protein